jgi:CTP synthase (UTP-ammonia lyase)
MPMATIALVGDRSQNVRAHARIPLLVASLSRREGLALDPYWIATDEVGEGLKRFDGIWIVPGSPYRNAEGAISAARIARLHDVPLLGTCGGFQHAALMLARDLCGIEAAGHAEYGPQGELVIVPLECSLVGHEGPIAIDPGSLLAGVMGVERSVERYHCSYGLAARYVERLEAAGVRFSARDEAGEVRAMELPGHPFFLCTLFQPELAGDGSRAHPVVRAFAQACAAQVAV